MKRHPSLEAFSRDHNVGLILGRKLVQAQSLGDKARQEAVRTLLEYWKDELEDHFSEEEKLLIPLIPNAELRARLVREHLKFAKSIANFAAGNVDPELIARAGVQLDAHIRWEERVLFPAIERAASPLEMQELAEQTEVLEDHRSNSIWSPRRGELMRRREVKGARTDMWDESYRLAIERWETEGGRRLSS